MAKAITTPFGGFDAEDEVVVVSTGLLGEVTKFEGTVQGERVDRGIHYLAVEDENGKVVEFPMTGGFVSDVYNSSKLSLPASELEQPVYNRV